MKKSIAYLKHGPIIKVLMMMVFLGVLLRIAFWGYIPRLETTNLDPGLFGIVLGGANLIAFLTSIIAKKYKDHAYIVYFVPIGVFGLMFMLLDGLIIILFAIFLHQISRGIINVVSGIYLNRAVTSDVRASIGSLIQTVVSLLYFVFSFTVDLVGMSQKWIMMINILLGISFIALWYFSQIYNIEKTQVKSINPMIGN